MTDTSWEAPLRTQRLQAERDNARKEASEAHAVYVAARNLHSELFDKAVRADLALENHKATIKEVAQ